MATKADNFDDYVKQWHAFAEVNGIPVQGVLYQPLDMTKLPGYIPPTYMKYGTGPKAHDIYISGLFANPGDNWENDAMTALRQYYSVTEPPQIQWQRFLNPPEVNIPTPKHEFLGPRVQGIVEECYMNNSGVAYEGSIIRIPEGTFELRPKPGGIGWATMYWFRKI